MASLPSQDRARPALPPRSIADCFSAGCACSVATAGSAEYDLTLNYMNDVLVRLGCAVVGGVGAAASDPAALKTAGDDAVALGRDLVRAIEKNALTRTRMRCTRLCVRGLLALCPLTRITGRMSMSIGQPKTRAPQEIVCVDLKFIDSVVRSCPV